MYGDLKEKNGRWTRKETSRETITIAIAVTIILGIIWACNARAHTVASSQNPSTNLSAPIRSSYGLRTREIDLTATCLSIGTGSYECSSLEVLAKAKRIINWNYAVQTIKAIVTAYSQEEFPGKTASGVKGVVGTTIACPRSIPFGSYVRSEAFGLRTCMDRLSPRFDARFDVFVSSTTDAFQWGKRKEEITIYYDKTREDVE